MSERFNHTPSKQSIMKSNVSNNYSYSKSIDLSKDDILSKKQNIKQKMVNPFWIPISNNDLFSVREIHNEQKKLNDFSSMKDKSILKSIDMNSIRQRNVSDSLKNVGIYVTDVERKMNNIDNSILVNSSVKDIPRNINIKNHCQSLIISPKKTNNEFEKRRNEINSFKLENVRDYIEKTKHLSLIKYSIKNKNERISRIDESYRMELGAIKDSISCMITSKDNYEAEFNFKFHDYMKNIENEKYREESKLQSLIDQKDLLKYETNRSENKIMKLREKIDQLKEYKLFLISISMRKLSSHIRKKPIRRMNNCSPKRLAEEKIDELYKSPSDLVDDIKHLEYQNITLLNTLNDLTERNKSIINEINRSVNDEKFTDQEDLTKIIIDNDQLNKSKEKNNKLKEKKDCLIKCIDTNLKSITRRIYVREKYNLKIALLGKNCSNFMNYSGNDYLEIMRNVEKAYEYLNNKYNLFKDAFPEEVKSIEHEIENLRKRAIAKDINVIRNNQRILLMKNISDKLQKIKLKPTRNVSVVRYNPSKKKIYKNSSVINQHEPNLDDFLHYETQEFN